MFRLFHVFRGFPALQAEQHNQIKDRVLTGRQRIASGDTIRTDNKDAKQRKVCLFGKCFFYRDAF
jgi:hypothetical protein